MAEICGENCCSVCNRKQECGGCSATDGQPFGGICIAAECIKKGGMEAFRRLRR